MNAPRRGPGARPAGGRDDRLPRPPRGRRPAIDPAREVAYEALAAVHRDDAYANLVLPRMLRSAGLSGRDAAFATELTYGTLRQSGTLDAVIASAADRPVERIDPPVRDALRLGAYQLLHLRVGAHAAVATTVDLVRSLTPGAAGFANAVLRRIAESTRDEWLARLAPSLADDPIGNLALVHAHPQWIVRSIVDSLHGSLDEAALALAADNLAPPVQLCARPGLLDRDEFVASLPGATKGRFSPYAVQLGGGDPGNIAAVRDGRAHVQDEGSQLVATALTAAPIDGPDDRWLDLCAGPGGKAGLLGALARQRDASVTAVEIAPHRADLVEQAVRGLPVRVECLDGRDAGTEAPEYFDRVLVDAPCTGLGALRRRPEARWRRQPSDLPALTRLQRELLGSALLAVRPGGVVAYVTCSPHLVETEVTVTESARRSKIAVELVDARPLLPPDLPDLGSGPTVQLWPHRHGTDAMYLAVLQRT